MHPSLEHERGHPVGIFPIYVPGEFYEFLEIPVALNLFDGDGRHFFIHNCSR